MVRDGLGPPHQEVTPYPEEPPPAASRRMRFRQNRQTLGYFSFRHPGNAAGGIPDRSSRKINLGRDAFDAAPIWQERIGDADASLFFLIVFPNDDHRAADREARAVQ